MSTGSSSTSETVLFDMPVSSYAQKVRIAMREKNVPFKHQPPAGPDGPSPELRAANPRLEIPTLLHTGNAIFDSTVILEYLEDAFPTPALLPPVSDPGARARARIIEDLVDTHYEAVNWGWGEALWQGRAGEPGSALYERIKAQTLSQTKQIYDYLTEKLGGDEWFGGSRYGFGWADVAVIPVLNRSVHYGFGPPVGSPLDAWYKRVMQRPSVAQTMAEFEANVGMMATLAERIKRGEAKREYRDHRLEFLVKSGGLEIVQKAIENKNVRFSWPFPDENL